MENEKMVKVLDGNFEKGIAVTDTFIIAENAGLSHRSIRDNITKKWKGDLEEFGELRFETVVGNSNNPETYYLLNEMQATLLFSYLRNSPEVIRFKKALVKAFFAMRDCIAKTQEYRKIGIDYRKQLTEGIVKSGEQERMHGKAIPTYTNLIYKSIFGMNAKQLYEKRNIPKDTQNLKDYLTADELQQITEKENLVNGLLKLNYQYDSIKNILKVKW